MAEQCNVNDTNLNQYQRENQQLADHFLETYFFSRWKKPLSERDDYKTSIELIISPECNLGCKYCYLHRYRKDIFPASCFDHDLTIQNLHKILNWLTINDYCCELEIFSGELFGQEIGYEVMEIIYEWAKNTPKERRVPMITIPTNFTFIMSEEHTNKVGNLIERFREIDVCLGLSASFDGKYMEENRPFLPNSLDIKFNGVRDDDYYDRCFAFCQKYGCGLHPMVYSKNIEKWPQNFDWFQEKMEEYDLLWESLYLLQVRNEDWNTEQIKHCTDFIEHLYAFAWEKVGHDPSLLVSWILKGQGFNILGQPYTTCGRGITCGIQSQFGIRVSDLMVYPCHRLGYKDFYQGQFVDDDRTGLKFMCMNVESLVTTYTLHKESFPYCAQCPINKLCTGQCLGACYESNSNMFVPIPSVCALHHALALKGMECLKKYNAWGIMKNRMDLDHRGQFAFLEEYYAKQND